MIRPWVSCIQKLCVRFSKPQSSAFRPSCLWFWVHYGKRYGYKVLVLWGMGKKGMGLLFIGCIVPGEDGQLPWVGKTQIPCVYTPIALTHYVQVCVRDWGMRPSVMHLSMLEIRIERTEGWGRRSLDPSPMQQVSSEQCSSKSSNGYHLVSKQCPLTSHTFGHTQADHVLGSVYFWPHCEISAPQYHISPSSLNSGLCSNAISYRGHHGWPRHLK